MKTPIAFILTAAISISAAIAQTPQTKQKPPEIAPEDIIRITTSLVQTEVVVTDKNDQIIPDLKLEDFEVYENGKKQDVKFMEYVSVDTGRRAEGNRPAGLDSKVGADISSELAAQDVKRVVAFVIDDLTVPFSDLVTVRQVLRDFVDNQMQEGDLVAIVRTVGGKGLLQQFTSDRQLLRRAIAQLNVSTNPFQSYNNLPTPDKLQRGIPPSTAEGVSSATTDADLGVDAGPLDIGNAEDETSRLFRGLITLQTTTYVIDSLKQIPGRKSL